jgi:hypothetical protein
MNYLNKKRLVKFIKSYTKTKALAKNSMSTGDINAYLKQLIEIEKTKQHALSLITQNS